LGVAVDYYANRQNFRVPEMGLVTAFCSLTTAGSEETVIQRAGEARFVVDCKVKRHVGYLGIKDDNILPLLHRKRRVTFFTQDQDFFDRQLCHHAYCLVRLDVRADDATRLRATKAPSGMLTEAVAVGQKWK